MDPYLKSKIRFDLEKLPIDIRDRSHDKKFGTLGAPQIPSVDFTIYDPFLYTIQWGDTLSKLSRKFGVTMADLLFANPKIVDPNKIYTGQTIQVPARNFSIQNQLDLDFCVAFTTVELQDAVWGVVNDPLYQFAKIKQIRGEYTGYGANLRDGMNSIIKFGSLPLLNSPYVYNESPQSKTRDFLANWRNWPIGLDSIAQKEEDLSYFALDGSNDTFDNIRSTLWLHRQERRAVSFGLFWHEEWTEAPGGIIPNLMPSSSNGGAHDMAVVGQKTINGVMYLVFQQSWGSTAGNYGFYYFPRNIINLCFNEGYGAFSFSNQDKSGLTGMNVMTSIATLINSILGRI